MLKNLNMKKPQNTINLTHQFYTKYSRNYLHKKRRLTFRRNYHLLMIKTHLSYVKCNNLLHTFNVYKIPAQEHQVVDS